MSKFEESERKGRNLLHSFLQHLHPVMEQDTQLYDEVDYYAWFSEKSAVFEVKVRNLINKFTGKVYDEILLSVNKVEALIDRCVKYGLNAGYYACFFENKLYLFNVDKTPKRKGQQWCPRTTAGDNHDLVLKPVYYFKTADAFIYENEGNVWKLIQKP